MRAAALAALAVLAGCAGPPAPRPARAPVGVVDAGRLSADLGALASGAMGGRAAGSAGGRAAADYVEGRFREAGLDPAFADGFRQRVPLTMGAGANVVGRVLGTVHPQRVVVVAAHYDGPGVRGGVVRPGADDNASGVAALLALAERLAERPPQHTVVLAALDAEADGLVGAEALASDPPVALGAVLVVVALDMVARGPLWAAGTAHYPHLRPAVVAAVPEAGRLALGHDRPGPDDWTGSGGHAAFHRRGVPFLYLSGEDHDDVGRPADTVARIDPAAFARAAETVVRVVEALDRDHAALASGR